jgi:hypothetical protein
MTYYGVPRFSEVIEQWTSNFFARGTLKSPKIFWRHTQICQNSKIETDIFCNMKFLYEKIRQILGKASNFDFSVKFKDILFNPNCQIE